MMQPYNDNPFAELPAALVDELLAKSNEIGDAFWATFKSVNEQRSLLRDSLERRGLLKRDTDLGFPPAPTTCGIDGAFAIERLLGTDLLAVAGVAVEGLIPPSEKRHWEQPHHLLSALPILHNPDTETHARALMMLLEIDLASRAPHDVVFVDGSLTTPLIYLNQSLNATQRDGSSPGCQLVLDRIHAGVSAYLEMLRASRTDKAWVGVPKYTTRREVGSLAGWSGNYDDRALLTLLLGPGEYINPLPLQQPEEPWHLNIKPIPSSSSLEGIDSAIASGLQQLRVSYYRPHNWIPALRIEMAVSVADNRSRFAVVLQAVRHQCATASMLEPYPLYMADRIVKHIGRAIPAIRQAASQGMAMKYLGDVADIFLTMNSYRSETGR